MTEYTIIHGKARATMISTKDTDVVLGLILGGLSALAVIASRSRRTDNGSGTGTGKDGHGRGRRYEYDGEDMKTETHGIPWLKALVVFVLVTGTVTVLSRSWGGVTRETGKPGNLVSGGGEGVLTAERELYGDSDSGDQVTRHLEDALSYINTGDPSF